MLVLLFASSDDDLGVASGGADGSFFSSTVGAFFSMAFWDDDTLLTSPMELLVVRLDGTTPAVAVVLRMPLLDF